MWYKKWKRNAARNKITYCFWLHNVLLCRGQCVLVTNVSRIKEVSGRARTSHNSGHPPKFL